MRQTLAYRGFHGSTEYSAEDCLFHGSLLGIRDMVTYEGSDENALEANFKAAADEYLAFCQAEGKNLHIDAALCEYMQAHKISR